MKWNLEEEQMLKNLRQKHGKNCWNKISKEMNILFPKKDWNDRQCRDKYINGLQITDISAETNEWSQQELQLLSNLYCQHGSTWSYFSKYFPNKSLINIKNQFYNKLRKFCRTITKIQQAQFKHWRNFISYQNIVSILELSTKIQNWINQKGQAKNSQSKLFIIRDSILKLAFSDPKQINQDLMISTVVETRNLNGLLKCLGIYKLKSKKGWELIQKRISFISKFDRFIECQKQCGSQYLDNNSTMEKQDSPTFYDCEDLESLDFQQQSQFLRFQDFDMDKLAFLEQPLQNDYI